jgi:hypothetical protein
MMPPIPGQSPPLGVLAAATRRVFSRSDNDPPIPTYVNAIEFTGLGMDVVMDVGIVSPESIIKARDRAAKEPESTAPAVVDLQVFFRFGMSLQTAVLAHQRLSQMLQMTQEQQEAILHRQGAEVEGSK